MELVIIKYNAGNVVSVANALMRLGVQAQLSDDPEQIRRADKVIFPGVGEASTAMEYLRMRGLDKMIAGLRQPFLGICLGLQLMCDHSEENDTECLGIFSLRVKKFQPVQKVPHMGWNEIRNMKGPLFEGLDQSAFIYFVHSYYAEIGAETVAVSDYIQPFSAALNKDNFYAVQGHPEKSGRTGERILENFLNIDRWK
jgi:imidazole glycerol-phosphate synthase subunit HisH